MARPEAWQREPPELPRPVFGWHPPDTVLGGLVLIAAALAITLAMVLAGCGHPATPARVPAILAKLDAHGCIHGPAHSGDKDAATCQKWAHGGTVNVWVFASQGREQTWLSGWTNDPPGVLVTGPRWVVEVSTEAQAGEVVSALGGTAQ